VVFCFLPAEFFLKFFYERHKPNQIPHINW
jgi:hypothetical protein